MKPKPFCELKNFTIPLAILASLRNTQMCVVSAAHCWAAYPSSSVVLEKPRGQRARHAKYRTLPICVQAERIARIISQTPACAKPRNSGIDLAQRSSMQIEGNTFPDVRGDPHYRSLSRRPEFDC